MVIQFGQSCLLINAALLYNLPASQHYPVSDRLLRGDPVTGREHAGRKAMIIDPPTDGAIGAAHVPGYGPQADQPFIVCCARRRWHAFPSPQKYGRILPDLGLFHNPAGGLMSRGRPPWCRCQAGAHAGPQLTVRLVEVMAICY